MSDFPSEPRSESGEMQDVRHLVTPFQLAVVAAVLDAQQSSENPANAVDRAAALIHHAQWRIHSPFHQDDGLSEAESDQRESMRLQRNNLFKNSLTVAAAFDVENAGYKNLGRFAAALRTACLSYETLESVRGGWRVVEHTSREAVAILPHLKKVRATAKNTANRKQKREKSKKSVRTADSKNRMKAPNTRTAKQKIGTAAAKKGNAKNRA